MKPIAAANDWSRMISRLMSSPSSAPGTNIVQLYGLHSIARMEVNVDENGLVDEHVVAALDYCLNLLQIAQKNTKFGCNQLIFLCYALLQLLSIHAVRAEFFDTNAIELDFQQKNHSSPSKKNKTDEILLNAAIEKYIDDKLSIFCK